jgi:hypothetical protein
MLKTILISMALQYVGYNGDDYMRPDIRGRRLERQEDQRWQSEKFRWEQDRYRNWLDSISRPRN